MIREEIVHINGVPKKLVVFLHGNLDSSHNVDQKLKSFAILFPQ